MSSSTLLRDPGTERALLGTIIKNGKDAFIDADSVVSVDDFSSGINRAIYTVFKGLSDDANCQSFDVETIKMKAKSMGLQEYFKEPKQLQYLEHLDSFVVEKNNIPMFAYQIKKYATVRELYSRYTDAAKYLETISGNEPLSEILAKAEGTIVDFVTNSGNPDSLETIGEDIIDRVEEMIANEPVDQVGLPTGFPQWDDAIGGGPRRGTITIVGARPKVGKSYMADNVSVNLSKVGIPVLYLDTELTRPYQQDRLLSIDSGCPMRLLETGRFKEQDDLMQAVRTSAQSISKWPLHYKSIAGMSHTEALAYARRWLVKEVGFNDKGKANDCAIVYDYMKLTSGSNLTKFTPEYIMLGLMLTEMHQFAVKYDVPIIGFVQLNRDGIDNEDGSIIAGSDRILWLCSSMSLLRNKTEADVEMQSPWVYGNKKLSILETRQGSGLDFDKDFINIKASLRPNTPKEEATGQMREGFKHSEVIKNGQFSAKEENKSENAGPNNGSR